MKKLGFIKRFMFKKADGCEKTLACVLRFVIAFSENNQKKIIMFFNMLFNKRKVLSFII
jgi:hypothetical protein